MHGEISIKCPNIMSIPATFFELQRSRFLFRMMVIRQALIMGAFWCAALLLASWFESNGLIGLSALLFALWVYLVIPAIIVQLAVFADIANYCLTGKAYLVRFFEEQRAAKSLAQIKAELRAHGRWSYGVAMLRAAMWDTSPLAPISMWGVLVLYRLPESAHQHAPTEVRELQHRTHEAELRVAHRRLVAAG
jgi:hypothetical protein